MVEKNKMGIMVFTEPLFSEYINEFLQIVDSQYPTHVFVEWQEPENHKQNGIGLVYSSCAPNSVQNTNVLDELYLYRIPESVTRNFLITDLKMPICASGAIVIIEAGPCSIRNESLLNILEKMKEDINMSAVAWAKLSHLPLIIVLVKEKMEMFQIFPNDLLRIYDLGTDTPIISCPSGFNKEDINKILRKALERIFIAKK